MSANPCAPLLHTKSYWSSQKPQTQDSPSPLVAVFSLGSAEDNFLPGSSYTLLLASPYSPATAPNSSTVGFYCSQDSLSCFPTTPTQRKVNAEDSGNQLSVDQKLHAESDAYLEFLFSFCITSVNSKWKFFFFLAKLQLLSV